MDRKELRKLIPFGKCQEIAQKAGVSTKTVSEFFAGNNNNISVELAVLEMATKTSKKRNSLLNEMNAENV